MRSEGEVKGEDNWILVCDRNNPRQPTDPLHPPQPLKHSHSKYTQLSIIIFFFISIDKNKKKKKKQQQQQQHQQKQDLKAFKRRK